MSRWGAQLKGMPAWPSSKGTPEDAVDRVPDSSLQAARLGASLGSPAAVACSCEGGSPALAAASSAALCLAAASPSGITGISSARGAVAPASTCAQNDSMHATFAKSSESTGCRHYKHYPSLLCINSFPPPKQEEKIRENKISLGADLS